MEQSLISDFINFIQEIIKSLNNGIFFFGGYFDVIRYIADILLIAFIFYKLIGIFRETRAWQLLKGIFLIVLFIFISSLLGFEMINYLVNRLLYIIAIAFVVIFQPELRRTIEAVGLKSFTSFGLSGEKNNPQGDFSKMVDEIVLSCVKMSSQFTGALIIIERNSMLSELLEQENAVLLDSAVSDNLLQSIFYGGSPLHDGALLIRDGRIIGARCHVPLADDYHVIENLGTRHRAAIGASRLGDAIAIAVSEERGRISVAVDGNLIVMKDGEELKDTLRSLLGIIDTSSSLKDRLKWKIAKFIHFRKKRKTQNKRAKKNRENKESVLLENAATGNLSLSKEKNIIASSGSSNTGLTRSQKVIFFFFSLLLSSTIWMYIQITTNPITQKTLNVTLVPTATEHLPEKGLAPPNFPVTNISVVITGRKNQINDFKSTDLEAYIDLSQISEAGVVQLPILVRSSFDQYYRIISKNPEWISIQIYETDLIEETAK